MQNVEELEEALSAPTDAVVEVFRHLDGDLLILGVNGKLGPSLARMARRALDRLGDRRRVVGVSRFSEAGSQEKLERHGIETIRCDLLDDDARRALPPAENVILLAGTKFGSTGQEARTWAVNTHLPGSIAREFRGRRLLVCSTGTVYGLAPVAGGGSRETDQPVPIGEYGMSCLGRERMVEYFSGTVGFDAALVRLNYACELRYGVLVDVACKVWREEPIDLAMGYFNTIWQGDANAMMLQSLGLATRPPALLNLTGPELLRVREVAEEFGRRFGKAPRFVGAEGSTAILSNATRLHGLFGRPRVTARQLMDWIVPWIRRDGTLLGKPTHYEVRDGKF